MSYAGGIDETAFVELRVFFVELRVRFFYTKKENRFQPA
jgi:hypothetical protein